METNKEHDHRHGTFVQRGWYRDEEESLSALLEDECEAYAC
jgi:hypothetical protein